MHDVLNSVKQKPIPKFHKNSKIFEKSQKLGQKHEMHEKVKERDLTRRRKINLGQKYLGNEVWSERDD